MALVVDTYKETRGQSKGSQHEMFSVTSVTVARFEDTVPVMEWRFWHEDIY